MSSLPDARAAASASQPESDRGDAPDRSEAGRERGGLATVRRLRRRAEFLAAARGLRWTATPFTLQAKARSPGAGLGDPALGLGFTATRKLGNAVVRNRARRRLKEAARQVLPGAALPGIDYVIVARPAALTCAFTQITSEMVRAFAGIRRKLEGSATGPRSGSRGR